MGRAIGRLGRAVAGLGRAKGRMGRAMALVGRVGNSRVWAPAPRKEFSGNFRKLGKRKPSQTCSLPLKTTAPKMHPCLLGAIAKKALRNQLVANLIIRSSCSPETGTKLPSLLCKNVAVLEAGSWFRVSDLPSSLFTVHRALSTFLKPKA